VGSRKVPALKSTVLLRKKSPLSKKRSLSGESRIQSEGLTAALKRCATQKREQDRCLRVDHIFQSGFVADNQVGALELHELFPLKLRE
jgi:hypothetical protein